MKTINGLLPYQIIDNGGTNYIFGKPGQYKKGEIITCHDGWKQTIVKEMTIDEWQKVK